MKNKNLILILVIIVALAGAGVFAYISFFGSSTATTPTTNQTVGAGTILPYGKSLNFETVNKFNETGRMFPYPEVTPADAGLMLSEIISQ